MAMLFGFFTPGPIQLLVVLLVVLLLFGHRLPALARSLGRGVVEFKKGAEGLTDESESDKEEDVRQS